MRVAAGARGDASTPERGSAHPPDVSIPPRNTCVRVARLLLSSADRESDETSEKQNRQDEHYERDRHSRPRRRVLYFLDVCHKFAGEALYFLDDAWRKFVGGALDARKEQAMAFAAFPARRLRWRLREPCASLRRAGEAVEREAVREPQMERGGQIWDRSDDLLDRSRVLTLKEPRSVDFELAWVTYKIESEDLHGDQNTIITSLVLHASFV